MSLKDFSDLYLILCTIHKKDTVPYCTTVDAYVLYLIVLWRHEKR